MAVKETELIIKEAAKKIFQSKGYAATKTRDIAEEAGINLALLNYYFRSKKKLYDIIMLETMHAFSAAVTLIINDEETTIKEKIELFVEKYIDVISENTDIPFFIMNAIREDPEGFTSQFGVKMALQDSVLVRQFGEAVQKGEIPMINPLHFMMNLAGLVVFPFIATPMISAVSKIPKAQIIEIIQERKKLIPQWIEAMLKIN